MSADAKTLTLDAALLRNCARDPARVMYQDPRGQIRAGELAVAAYMLGAFLRKATKSNTVAVCLPTIKEYPLAVFGILLAGKTVVPLNFLLQPDELVHIVRDSGADTVITSQHFAEKLKPLPIKQILVEDLAKEDKPKDIPTPKPAESPQEVAVLLYTSGTTALPKGVKLTHRNFLAQTESIGGVIDLSNFHILSALPNFHTFAMCTTVMLPALSGCRASYLPQFDPGEVVGAFETYGANALVGVPSMHRMIARAAKRVGKSASDLGLTLAIAGGEKCPDSIAEEFEKILGIPLLQGYGLTEHSPAVSFNLPEANKKGTIGKALPGVQWRTVDGEGNTLPQGEEGELQLNSDSVMAGYHNTDDQPFTSDGWLRTGDLAVIDEEGFARITGRIKELIISAGKNIHPSEIEDVARTYPDVEECAAIAVPDKTRGEAAALFFIATNNKEVDTDEFRDWLRENLAEYKRPRVLKQVEDLPRNALGKVMRRRLAKLLE